MKIETRIGPRMEELCYLMAKGKLTAEESESKAIKPAVMRRAIIAGLIVEDDSALAYNGFCVKLTQSGQAVAKLKGSL